MVQSPTATAEVQNIEIDGNLVIDSFPTDSLVSGLTIARRDDYERALADLRDRYTVSLQFDSGTGEFIPERDVHRLHRFRHWAVTTAAAQIQVRQAYPESSEWWCALEGELRPVRHLLSLVYRRSINLVRFESDGHKAPTYDLEPRLLASNYSRPLIEGDRFRLHFVSAALPRYRALMVSVAPFEHAFHDALLYYLGSFRDGLRIEENFLSLFISLEILANARAEQANRSNMLSDDDFSRLLPCLCACVEGLPPAVPSATRDSLRATLEHVNRSSIRRKVRHLADEHGLQAYKEHIGPWIEARNQMVHSGVIKALATPADPDGERQAFWEACLARLGGFLERLLVSMLLPGGAGRLYWFSDAWEKDDRGRRWRGTAVWPEE